MEYDSPIRYRARSPTLRHKPLLESPVRTSATPFYSPARRTFVDDPVDAAAPATTYDPYYRPSYYYDRYDRYDYYSPRRYYPSYHRSYYHHYPRYHSRYYY